MDLPEEQRSSNRAMEHLILPTRENHSMVQNLKWTALTPVRWIDELMEAANRSKVSRRDIMDGYEGEFFFDYSLEGLSTDATSRLQAVQSQDMPNQWDFHGFQPSPLMERIRCLVLSLERQPNFDGEIQRSFEHIREQFMASSLQPHFHHEDDFATSYSAMHSDDFYFICIETVQKLEALLELAVRLERVDGGQPRADKTGFCVSPHSKGRQSTNPAMESILMNWLKSHWADPFPDKPAYEELMDETGLLADEIGEWLSCHREALWKPSIAEAFELGRPSCYLFEDSLNIAFGRSLRNTGSFPEQEPNKCPQSAVVTPFARRSNHPRVAFD